MNVGNNNYFARLANALSNAAENKSADSASQLCFGTIATVNPLSIQVDGKTTLPASFFWLGNWCKPVKITIPHSHLLGLIDMGDHSHQYGNATETAGLHQHAYAGKTNDDGKHSHLQQGHQHSTEDGATGSATAVNNEAPEHSHGYSGSVDQNGEHTHNYSGDTQETNVSRDFFNVSDTQGVEEEYIELEIYPKLAVGDRVVLFSFNQGQMYYVAERI